MCRRIITSLITIIAASFALNTQAVGPGFYMGLMMGPATNDGGTQQAQTGPFTTTPATPKSNQFGSRVFMGYQMNNYFAFEGGLNYFTGIKYDTKNVNTCSSVQARIRSFDVLGKGIFPFGEAFDVYGKAGVALVYQTLSGALNPMFGSQCGKTTYSTKFRPAASIGASYAFNQNWVIDISWNRTMVGSVVKNVDFFGVGLSYHFVDKYCGQFLCD